VEAHQQELKQVLAVLGLAHQLRELRLLVVAVAVAVKTEQVLALALAVLVGAVLVALVQVLSLVCLRQQVRLIQAVAVALVEQMPQTAQTVVLAS
jgi:hypothetical protein